jgi:hypothetical protein
MSGGARLTPCYWFWQVGWSGTIAVAQGIGGMRPNSALVSDACAAALRAFYSAAQRGR